MFDLSRRVGGISNPGGTETRRPGTVPIFVAGCRKNGTVPFCAPAPAPRTCGRRSARAIQRLFWLAVGALLLASTGCTSLHEYVYNGFKVGPNYRKPAAPVACHWIDEAQIRVREGESLAKWWMVFNDERLNYLIHCAYQQNINLKDYAFRVLAARAQLAIARGDLFPQNQNFSGSYSRNSSPNNPPFASPIFYSVFNYGFNLNWELDFWGALRRAITSAADNVDVSVETYDAVLVTLLHDVATNYVSIRTYQRRIQILKQNVEVQRGVLAYIQARFKAGFKMDERDLDQGIANLRQTESGIPLLEIQLRQFEDALCTLLGMPPRNLEQILGDGPIPISPPEVAIGIPADLLRRRPDVRAAERAAAAQAEQIGIAQAQLYPMFTINGSVGYGAQEFSNLFLPSAFAGSIGPSFQWNVFNYGRIINNIRFQDATFQHLVAAYQQTVLTAAQQVEDGLAQFLKSQQETTLLDESVVAALKAVKIVVLQYEVGSVDFNTYATIEQAAVTQQDAAATARGNIGLGLINVYTAMGGGWEIRLSNAPPPSAPPVTPPATTPSPKVTPEEVPIPPSPPNDIPTTKEIAPPPPTDPAKANGIALPPQSPFNAAAAAPILLRRLPNPYQDVALPAETANRASQPFMGQQPF